MTVSGSPDGFVGKTLTFGSVVDQEPGVNDSLTYAWSVLNGDGSAYHDSTTGILSTFVVPGTLAKGSYEVQLTVEDDTGSSSIPITQTFPFTVLPDPVASDFDFGTAPSLSTLITTIQGLQPTPSPSRMARSS